MKFRSLLLDQSRTTATEGSSRSNSMQI